MNVLEIKGSIFDLLWGVEDEEILLKIRELVYGIIDRSRQQGEDWWDELSPEQQARLDRALEDAGEGQNLFPHEQVMQEVEANLKSPIFVFRK